MKTFDRQKTDALAEKHGLQLLLLFGSQASGKTHDKSDYDFAFLSQKDLDFGERAALRDDLASLVDYASETEEADLKQASPFLLKQILENHSVVYAAGSAYEEFYSYAFRTCLESKRLFDLQDELYRNTVAKYRKIYAE